MQCSVMDKAACNRSQVQQRLFLIICVYNMGTMISMQHYSLNERNNILEPAYNQDVLR
jgi:hypothetical protein